MTHTRPAARAAAAAADLLRWGRGARTRSEVNYVALLAVLAATSFVLPLLVQGCEVLGLQRGASVAVSLVLAAGWLAFWVTRAFRVAAKARAPEDRGASRNRRSAPGGPATGVVDGTALRLMEAEEESRAGV